MNPSASTKRQAKKISETSPSTLVSKQWHIACTVAATLFPVMLWVLSYLLDYMVQYNPDSRQLCRPLQLSTSERDLKLMIMGASGSACIIQFSRMIVAYSKASLRNTFSAYATAFSIMLISFFGEITMMFEVFDKVYEDAFGVRTPIVQIAEWQITVPLMLYLNLTLDTRKASLGTLDYSVIGASYFGIIIAYFPLFLNWSWSVVAILASVLAIFYALAVNLYDAYRSYCRSVEAGISNPSDYISFAISRRRLQSSIYLLIICTTFPVAYFSRTFSVISDSTLFSILAVLNFVSKNLYAMFLMEGHLEVLDPAMYQLLAEKSANETKRAFIRYVFHEVRSPLNSMIMGLHVLFGTEAPLEEHETEAITTMREATTYMSETLNDVLSMQKIDEGLLELQFSFVDVKRLALNVISSYKDIITDKRINFTVKSAPDVPISIIGDIAMLELTLGNFVSNALKFSEPNSNIEIDICRYEDRAGTACVYFLIKDEGMGVTEEEQEKIFLPYSQLKTHKPGEITINRGSAIGLAICKEVVEKHGGEVGCRPVINFTFDSSQPVEGNEFYFYVPIGDAPDEISPHGYHVQIRPNKDGSGSSLVVSSLNGGELPVEASSLQEKAPPAEESEPLILPLPPVKSALRNTRSASAASRAPSATAPAAREASPPIPDGDNTNSSRVKFAAAPSIVHSASNSDITQAAAKALEEADGKQLTFLLVDDVLSNRRMLSFLLKKKGVECDLASDGQEALAMVEANPGKYDLVFMDNMMPNMSGVQATKSLRERGFGSIIMGLTGNTLEEELVEFENAGADAVLPKPLNIRQVDSLLAYVRKSGDKTTIADRSMSQVLSPDPEEEWLY